MTDPEPKEPVLHPPDRPAPQPLTMKSLVDRDKPWFDYASCYLTTAAWFLAVLSVAWSMFRPRPPVPTWGFDIVTWAAVVCAAGYVVFLITRLVRMTVELGHLVSTNENLTPFWRSVFGRALWFWLGLGMPLFCTALFSEVLLKLIEPPR